jgi:hypothetical protein
METANLATGTINSIDRPKEILLGDVTAVVVGGAHSPFLKSDSSLWQWVTIHTARFGDYRTTPEQIFPAPELKSLNVGQQLAPAAV